MRLKSLFIGLLALSSISVFAQKQHIDYINTFIGTDGMGHTFPGACVPFGAVQLSPDTDTIPHNVAGKYQPRTYEYCAGYKHSDNTIVGFSHTHFSGTGHSDELYDVAYKDFYVYIHVSQKSPFLVNGVYPFAQIKTVDLAIVTP